MEIEKAAQVARRGVYVRLSPELKALVIPDGAHAHAAATDYASIAYHEPEAVRARQDEGMCPVLL